MKCTIPEISWHNKDPILTLDIQHNSPDGIYRLATGGTDTHVVIWQLFRLENGGVSVEILSDLTRHNRAVNAVRFSPDGQTLASSDDEAAIILWKCNEDKDGSHDLFSDDNGKDNKENWSILRMLRGHIEDVYDLCWSRCSQFIISGSVDNTAIMWNAHKGKNIGLLKEHKGFVQGVTWDPRGQYVGTLSSDRFMRIFNANTKKTICRVQKVAPHTKASKEDSGESKEDLPEAKETKERSSHLFYDDTLKSFCRRLAFSPDGELLLAPTAILEGSNGKQINGTHVFSRHCLNRPVMFLPTKSKYTVAVRFCPIYFELKNKPPSSEDTESQPKRSYTRMFSLPYRMIFAVAAQNAVFFYDTEQPMPFAKVSDIHYTRLSDLSWSSDGLLLVISSTDGYCSLVSFDEGELGVEYKGDITVLDKVPLEKVSPPKKKDKFSTPARKLVSLGTPKESKSGTLSEANTPKSVSVLTPKSTPSRLTAKATPTVMTPKSTPTSSKSESVVKAKKSLTRVHEMSPKSNSSQTPKSSEPDVKSMDIDLVIPVKKDSTHTETDCEEPCRRVISEEECSVEKNTEKEENKSEPIIDSNKIEKPTDSETTKVVDESQKEETKPAPMMISSKKSGRRVQLITLSSKSITPNVDAVPNTVEKMDITSSETNSCASSSETRPSSSASSNENETELKTSPKRSASVEAPVTSLTPKAPRRINLITLSSPKTSKKAPTSDL